MYAGVRHNDNSLHVTLHVMMNLSSHLWLTVSLVYSWYVPSMSHLGEFSLVHMSQHVVEL